MKNLYFNLFEDDNLPYEDYDDNSSTADNEENSSYDIRIEEPSDPYNFYPDFGF